MAAGLLLRLRVYIRVTTVFVRFRCLHLGYRSKKWTIEWPFLLQSSGLRAGDLETRQSYTERLESFCCRDR